MIEPTSLNYSIVVWEYATTRSEFLTPIEPPGNRWELVAMAASDGWLFWTWKRASLQKGE